MSVASESKTEESTLPSDVIKRADWGWRILHWLKFLAPVLTLVLLFLFWEWAVAFWKIEKFKLPAPSEIWRSTFDWWQSQDGTPRSIPAQVLVTLYETLAGFGLGVIIGIPLAIMIALSRTLQNTIYPVLLVFQSVPKVALAPVLVFSMGLNDWPKITVAFLVSFFPIIVDTATGLKAVDPELMDMIRSFSANPWQAFIKVRFPAALPFIFSGLKVAISLAVVGAVIGEFVASDKGLGNLILIATANANNGLAFGAMLLLSLMGIVLFGLVTLIERLVLWYR